MNAASLFLVLVLGAGMFILLMVLLRGLWCWVLRINDIVRTLEKIAENLLEIRGSLLAIRSQMVARSSSSVGSSTAVSSSTSGNKDG